MILKRQIDNNIIIHLYYYGFRKKYREKHVGWQKITFKRNSIAGRRCRELGMNVYKVYNISYIYKVLF